MLEGEGVEGAFRTITMPFGHKYIHLIPGEISECDDCEGWLQLPLEVRITGDDCPDSCYDSSDEVILSWEEDSREVYGSDQTEALDGPETARALANALMGTDYATP